MELQEVKIPVGFYEIGVQFQRWNKRASLITENCSVTHPSRFGTTNAQLLTGIHTVVWISGCRCALFPLVARLTVTLELVYQLPQAAWWWEHNSSRKLKWSVKWHKSTTTSKPLYYYLDLLEKEKLPSDLSPLLELIRFYPNERRESDATI